MRMYLGGTGCPPSQWTSGFMAVRKATSTNNSVTEVGCYSTSSSGFLTLKRAEYPFPAGGEIREYLENLVHELS